MDEQTMRETAELLRGLVNAAHDGELEASSPAARALLRRLEGAAIALEQATAS